MKWRALVGVMLTIAAFAAPAQAQSVQDGYGGRADVLGEVGTVEEDQPTNNTAPTQENAPTTTAQPAEASNGLPFTGADVGLLVVGGLTLVGAGVVLRRIAVRQSI